MSKFNESTANFAFNLMRQVAKENEDMFFSPTSITLALAKCYAGSDGKTKSEMNSCLFGNSDDSEIHGNLSQLVTSLNEMQGFIQCNAVNRLYCRKDFQVLQTYRDLLQKSYKSDIYPVEFSDSTRKEINEWVSKATREKIKNILPIGSLDKSASLILVNALYFKAEWNEQFEKRLTSKKMFYMNPNRAVNVDMMKLSHRFRYIENDECQAILIPYASFRAEMVIVLPKEKFGLKNLETKLTGNSLLELLGSMQAAKVNLEMPKFKFEIGFSVNKSLQAIGITEAFNENADFSGITGGKGLCISQIAHKAFVDMNEDGTEAAGATSIKMITMSAIIDPNPPKSFIADHPFMFAILNSDNNILFLGHFYASSI